MKKYLLYSIMLIAFLHAVKAQEGNDSDFVLNAIKQSIEEDKGTFPRDMGFGMTWDSLALVGQDYTYFYTFPSNKNIEDKLKIDEDYVRKILLRMGSEELFRDLVDANLNVAFNYAFGGDRPNIMIRITNQELRDFLAGNLVVTTEDVMDALYTNYLAMLPVKYEDGSTMDNVEMRNEIFAIYCHLDNSALLNHIEMFKDEARINLKKYLSSTMFLSLCQTLMETHYTLAFVYHCGDRKTTFAFSPAELEEIVNESVIISDYNELDKLPEFPGGIEALMSFISQNLSYPALAVQNGWQGRVTLSFIVEKDGSISDIKEEMSPHSVLTEEAIRVVKMLPQWEPGYANGQPVRVRFLIPLTFRLDDDDFNYPLEGLSQ